MTNTKFRKRALLSSVAMLLVALVALGSATFAWFTEDPTADAQGIPAYAQTSKGLLIFTDTDTTPSHHARLAKSVTGGIYLAPATTNDGLVYKTIDAAAANAHTLDTQKTWQNATMVDHVSGTGVYQETMTLQMTTPPTGTDTQNVYLKGVTITLKNASHKMASALVVTLAYGSTVKHFSVSGDDVATWTNLTGNGSTTTTTTLTVDTAATGLTEQVGTFSASTTTVPVEVYVWLNGEDSNVYTDNSDASQLLDKVQFDFSLNA